MEPTPPQRPARKIGPIQPSRQQGFMARNLRKIALATGIVAAVGGGYETGKKLDWWGTETGISGPRWTGKKGEQKPQTPLMEATPPPATEERSSEPISTPQTLPETETAGPIQTSPIETKPAETPFSAPPADTERPILRRTPDRKVETIPDNRSAAIEEIRKAVLDKMPDKPKVGDIIIKDGMRYEITGVGEAGYNYKFIPLNPPR